MNKKNNLNTKKYHQTQTTEKTQVSELELVRLQKLNALKEQNILPFTSSPWIEDNFESLNQKYHFKTKDELNHYEIKTSVAGRIMAFRGPFIVIKDGLGTIQIYVAKEQKNIHKLLKLIDVGDIVWFQGIVMKTNTNQIALKSNKIKLLTKSLKPLPEKWHGLKDVELRYRKRYLDLISNDEVKQTFWTRTKIIQNIRKYFDALNYMEVETPVLHEILGGAAAKPFITQHNALKMNFYLRIATELPLKKLLVGGIDRVYEIGRIFRNEGIDTSHNPEFTSIEFYEAYANLEIIMQRTEDLIKDIANNLNLSEVVFQGQKIDLKSNFKRIDMVKAVGEITKTDWFKITKPQAIKIAKKYNIKVEPYFEIGHIISALFEELVEPNLIQPTFVTNFPIEISPLAAKNLKDPRFTDRAELFINAREYANMFTELNDPIDQKSRFEAQLKEKNAGNEEANEVDYEFIEALEYGMPPSGGCGIGIDRLVMLLTDKHSIREVLLFPHLKHSDHQQHLNQATNKVSSKGKSKKQHEIKK